ncbi:ABC transporter ATP-binding protein [Georgenia sp. TF02-10]|uniref:ABC transporter ATP-binding protein n=1 Tax=Georgenia sp. TF02-10 TaxID=2917725 RepID=UPI001FA741FA|nr:ABC transporter ATP-binding protein [Georgenia sp. TF02-10]UNX53648.1 ABC transporter ATP-binding protein [Georgenia sp. TF02-10]
MTSMTSRREHTLNEQEQHVGSSAIAVEDLVMQYGQRRVLDHVSLEIPIGESVSVLGPNGAGKSTFIEILEGLRKPSSGRVEVLDADPAHATEAWKSRVGVVLQSWRDHGTWRVRDLLTYARAAHSAAGVQALWSLDDLLETVGLMHLQHQRLRTLSGGQRRRVDVAAALISRPQLLFLDEPTTGFDPEARRDFHALMASISDSTTFVWATHDLDEAQKMCKRILILDQGNIVADGNPDALRRQAAVKATVQWTDTDGPHSREVEDSRGLVQRLSNDPAVRDIEVRRGTLEDAYLSIVTSVETHDQGKEAR